MLSSWHHRDKERVTFTTLQLFSGLKQEEVTGSDRPIYLTPAASEACGEAHSLSYSMCLSGLPLPQTRLSRLGVHEFWTGTVTGSMYRSQNNLLVTFW